MRRCLFGWGLLLPLFLGCSGEHVVAGEQKTKAEQLEAALPAWCPSTCERLRACPPPSNCDCNGDVCDCVGVDDGCEEQCPLAFARYTDAGEFCAAVGQRLQGCIDRLTCDDLSGRDPCRPTNAEVAACPDPNDLEDTPSGTQDNPTSTGGTSSTGSGGPGINVGPTSCTDSIGSAGASPQSSGPRVTCEEARSGCSDGHVYSWICSQDSQGQRACACLVDSQAAATFVPNSSDCPLLTQVNAGCGWALTQ